MKSLEEECSNCALRNALGQTLNMHRSELFQPEETDNSTPGVDKGSDMIYSGLALSKDYIEQVF